MDVVYDWDGVKYRVDQPYAVRMERMIKEVVERLHLELDGGEANEEFMDPPSGALFDGCETCTNREIMVMAIAFAVRGMEEGLVERLPDAQSRGSGPS